MVDKALADTRNEANAYVIDEHELRSIQSLDDAFETLENLSGVEDFSDYGTGFDIVDNKDRLIDTTMLFLEWRFTKSKEYKTEFVSILAMTKEGGKFIINDGSTGICKQLRMVTDERINAGRPNPQTGLKVSRGLRRSDYEILDESTGEMIKSSTYYLA